MNYAILSLSIFLAQTGDGSEGIRTSEAVERAARDYRIEVYYAYRHDRAEYDRRIDEGKELLTKWRTGTIVQAQQEQVVQWFYDAQLHSANGGQSPLPEKPVWAARQDESLVADSDSSADEPQITSNVETGNSQSPLEPYEISAPVTTETAPTSTESEPIVEPSVLSSIGGALLNGFTHDEQANDATP